MTTFLFIRPMDVLFFRGNEAFGDTGQHGQALMPPWPSVFAGALRSAILAADPQVELGLFTEQTAEGEVKSEMVRKIIGTPRKPGSFRVTFVSLGTEKEVFFPLPADLLVWGNGEDQTLIVRRSLPVAREHFAFSQDKVTLTPFSFPNGLTHVLTVKQLKKKPTAGWWLKQEGMLAYLRGELPQPNQFIHVSRLWSTDFRLGIARSRDSYTAEEHRIYTAMAIVLAPDVGFVVGVDGVESAVFPEKFLVRLGGDGRGAEVVPWQGRMPRCEHVRNTWFAYCLTPCLSPQGWQPPNLRRENGALFLNNSQLVAACVPRSQVVSGWDLAAHQPKPSQAAIPQGSVFYFRGQPPCDEPFVAGLESWLKTERDPRPQEYVWRQRLAEGFNLTLIGVWPETH